jgi:hypothetical protein
MSRGDSTPPIEDNRDLIWICFTATSSGAWVGQTKEKNSCFPPGPSSAVFLSVRVFFASASVQGNVVFHNGFQGAAAEVGARPDTRRKAQFFAALIHRGPRHPQALVLLCLRSSTRPGFWKGSPPTAHFSSGRSGSHPEGRCLFAAAAGSLSAELALVGWPAANNPAASPAGGRGAGASSLRWSRSFSGASPGGCARGPSSCRHVPDRLRLAATMPRPRTRAMPPRQVVTMPPSEAQPKPPVSCILPLAVCKKTGGRIAVWPDCQSTA